MQNFEFFTCYTLIDITRTGVIRTSSDTGMSVKRRDQQRNWETLIQVLSLRTQPMYLEDPVQISSADLAQFAFGDAHSGNHNVWKFTFASEHEGAYQIPDLMRDCNQVPCNKNLDETISLDVAIFSTAYDYSNTYFLLGRH